MELDGKCWKIRKKKNESGTLWWRLWPMSFHFFDHLAFLFMKIASNLHLFLGIPFSKIAWNLCNSFFFPHFNCILVLTSYEWLVVLSRDLVKSRKSLLLPKYFLTWHIFLLDAIERGDKITFGIRWIIYKWWY